MKKVPFILLGIVAIVIAVATFIESRQGTLYVHQHLYGTWWFIMLWALTALTGCLLLRKQKMRRRPSVLSLHISLLLILAGALTTHVTSRKGMLHLREGEATRSYWIKDEQGTYTIMQEMPFYLALKGFHITYDADGTTPSDYISQVVIATKDREEETTISMNNIGKVKGYRIYQTSYDDDEAGSVFTISYDPWGTAITYAGYLLLALSMVWISLRKRKQKANQDKPASWLPTIVLAVCGTAMASYMVIAICMRPLVPVLRSPYLFLHVGTILLSYILLVVSIVRRNVLRPAVFLLATGIFLGAVWANVSWGTYWSWDPKESWALVTLFIYSLPLHQKSLPWFQSKRHYRIYSIVALASLIMTYFGVNYLGGMHSYTQSSEPIEQVDTSQPSFSGNQDHIIAALDRLYTQSLRLDTADIAIEVYDIDSDTLLYSRNAHRLVPTASCMKLLTAVTALNLLGIDHAYSSRVVACGNQQGDTFNGIIRFELDDDPMLESLEPIVDAIRQQGIRQIHGNLQFDLTREDTLKAHATAASWDIPYNKLPILLKGRQRIEQDLRYLMAAKGITVKKESTIQSKGEERVIFRHQTPLTDVVTPMLIHSSNIKADALFHHIAQTCNRYPFLSVTPAECMKSQANLIAPNNEFVINDGSGLSPDNRLSAHFLTELLRYTWTDEPIRHYFIEEALATPGHPVRYGSLLYRMTGSPCQGKIFVKTGTLTTKALSSLAGYAQGRDGHWMAFAIVNENSPVAESRIFQDSVCRILVQ